MTPELEKQMKAAAEKYADFRFGKVTGPTAEDRVRILLNRETVMDGFIKGFRARDEMAALDKSNYAALTAEMGQRLLDQDKLLERAKYFVEHAQLWVPEMGVRDHAGKWLADYAARKK